MWYNKIVMHKERLYLDTSVINYALANDIALEDRVITNKLCDEINRGKYEAFISEVVLRELNNTLEPKRRQELLRFVEGIEWEDVLKVTQEVDDLAAKYISEGILGETNRDDALHVALTSVNSIEILVTWNFKHLVKHKTRIKVNGTNALMGYKDIDICTAREAMGNE